MAYIDKTTMLGSCNADTGDAPGQPADCKFIAPGEDISTAVANRPHLQLAENTDDLDARITRDIAAPEVGVLTGHSGTTIVIDPSGADLGNVNYTGTLYLGESGWATPPPPNQERLDQLFQLLDDDYNEVVIDGTEAKVTSLTGGSLGGGFVATAVTLNLNVTLPSGNYRIGYYYGTTVGTMPPYVFTHAGLRGLEESPGEDKTGYTAIFSDGTNSTGGQYNGADSVDALSTFTYGGRFLLKRGNYEFGTAPASFTGVDLKTETFNFGGGATDYTSMALPATVSSDLTLGGRYEKLILLSKHATYQYILSNTHLEDVIVPPGAVKVTGDVRWIRGSTRPGYTGSASTADYGVRFTGDNLRGYVENVWFEESASGGADTPSVLIDEVTPTGNQRRHLLFQNCDFVAYTGPALRINNVDMHITFEGCRFSGYEAYYAVECLGTEYDTQIRFVNCTFETAKRALCSCERSVYFENCRFATGPALASPANEVFKQDAGGLKDCTFVLDAGSIDDTATSTLIELGNGGGGIVAKNVKIDCGKVPRVCAVEFYGGTGGNASVFEDITLDIPAAPTVDRGAGGAHLRIVGDAELHRCVARNIKITSVTSDTVADTGNILEAALARIEGLLIDGAASTSGSYAVGIAAYGCDIYDLEYCPSNAIRCSAYHIGLLGVLSGEGSSVQGGALYKLHLTSSGLTVFELEDFGAIKDMICHDIEVNEATTYFVYAAGTRDHCSVEGNTFSFNTAVTNDVSSFISMAGNRNKVDDNMIWVKRSANPVITVGGNSLVDSNIVQYASGGGTPSIVGGTAGTNVLVA